MNAQQFATEWLEAWNAHDLEAILSHYADDIEITTPMIKLATGGNEDSLKGKQKVAEYWQNALNKFPNLTFELYNVTEGVNSIALYYKSILDKNAIEVMYFDDNDKVNKMFAFYTR